VTAFAQLFDEAGRRNPYAVYESLRGSPVHRDPTG
jgi:hypothetical protein